MKTVFRYALPYKWPMFIAILLMLLELSVELIQPLLIGRIIDEGIMKEDLNTVVIWGSVMMALAFVALFSGVINSYFAAHAAQSFGYDLRQALFQRVQTFSLAAFLRFPTSSLITRLTSDVTLAQNALFMGLRIMARAPLMVLGSLIMAFVVSPKLAVFLLIGAPFLAVFLVVMARKGVRLFGLVQRRLDGVNQLVQENLQAVRLIKAYLRGVFETDRFSTAARALKKDSVHAMRLMELILPVLLFIMNVSFMVVLWFGADEVRNSNMPVGDIVAIVNYTMRMTSAFSMFSFLIVIFSRAKASSDRMEELLVADGDLEKLAIADNLHQGAVSVRFEHVSFRYAGTTEDVLRDVSFEVPAGEKLVIMGATGSGKSTMLQLLPRMFTATEGTVWVNGKNIADWPLDTLRNLIGYVPQQSMLFTGSIANNLSWGKPNATANEMEEAAKKAQIHSSIMDFTGGYETRVGQRGVNLSGGQKQRLSIARALIRKPSLLILDDSTSALDVKTESSLWDALQEEDTTMLIVTQKIQTAQIADAILLLSDGKIVGYGTHEELLQTSSFYREIAESQQNGGVA
ncbi:MULTISPECIES: ABC transporter ATP-binding protein [unclassified Sporosarcina]|uniref:ABC transporter ATP-binding protein n=1 Tax=unclassified Sporosarcina TaxID=2647733 RepID=UPI000C16285F|nr:MULTISPECIES: ABC transporter ATP-binding protein [unclassified Sporosarcina]PIC98926.1 ABC transporter ATP-binding protein [Sporosarcina sp. P29]PID04820.1 ABC transporter ATP-binding protein [Sporosarcina sp. P30]PID07975.1 ABC transporter ATP-binding protein [Sporosarcina sp. P31]PID11161.1 ABC transporter ATP-binding protein [Sporosarcina sp. P32b]